MTTTSQVAMATYICALMRATGPAAALGQQLTSWLRYNSAAMGIEFDAAVRVRSAAGKLQPELPADKPLPKRNWDQLLRRVAKVAAATASADPAMENLLAFASVLSLAPDEIAILRFVSLTGRMRSFDRLCDQLIWTKAIDSLRLLSVALGQTEAAICDSLGHGQLLKLHLLEISGTGSEDFCYYLRYDLLQALLQPGSGLAAIEEALIGRKQSACLSLVDYTHLAEVRDFIQRLLRHAIDARKPGVNILLHGAPGTGKTEFCRTMADAIGCDLFAVGEADRDGDEIRRDQRLDALRLADRLAARRGRSLLLFDEMEDILQAGDRTVSSGQSVRRAGSKVFFNRLLEANAVPVLWTTNAIDELDPAFLRRMTFIVEMKPMPRQKRVSLWQQVAARHGIALEDGQLQRLARRHPLSPAAIVGALNAVAMAGGAAKDIDVVMTSLTGDDKRDAAAPTARFQPDLTNADIDLDRLTLALARPDAPRDVTFCFYGPPGTGKSAYARSLAEQMGLEVTLKKGSDLLGKWVGETEKLLAHAFAEAKREGSFLIIDEAENFLWRRGGAHNSWEVSMVNELLVQMESHPLPFACTTNHLEALDPAALRRFSFKVKFDFMTLSQARAAYRQFLGEAAPLSLDQLAGLTPGDFAVVAKKARIFNLMPDQVVNFVDLLAKECAAKGLPRRIGF